MLRVKIEGVAARIAQLRISAVAALAASAIIWHQPNIKPAKKTIEEN
jgi:hypothetical protein